MLRYLWAAGAGLSGLAAVGSTVGGLMSPGWALVILVAMLAPFAAVLYAWARHWLLGVAASAALTWSIVALARASDSIGDFVFTYAIYAVAGVFVWAQTTREDRP